MAHHEAAGYDVIQIDNGASTSSMGMLDSGGLPVTATERRGGKSHAAQPISPYDQTVTALAVTPKPTTAQRAETIIQKKSATPRPN
jgi:hypothetical protein